jgi:maleylpyruvate isomerase
VSRLRLFHYWRSSASWRVRFGFAFKGIVCEMVPVGLLDNQADSPEHKARNPMGFVPVLEFLDSAESTGPRRFMAESLAILEWANETQPGPSYFPTDPLLRARCRQLAETVNAGTQPLINLGVAEVHSPDAGEQKRWNQHWIRRGLETYETLARETAGKFSIGDTLTLADFCLIPQCYSAMRNEVSLDAYPTISRIHAAALETEAGRASHPERFKP